MELPGDVRYNGNSTYHQHTHTHTRQRFFHFISCLVCVSQCAHVSGNRVFANCVNSVFWPKMLIVVVEDQLLNTVTVSKAAPK